MLVRRFTGRTLIPATKRQPFGQRARIEMVLGEPIDHAFQSATIPAAAIIPAWRIPPPSTLRIRRARRDEFALPQSSEPTGQASPFERQNETVSANDAIFDAVVSSASAALKIRAPSRCTGSE